MIRTLLRKLIVWALADAPPYVHDAAGMDKIASETAEQIARIVAPLN